MKHRQILSVIALSMGVGFTAAAGTQPALKAVTVTARKRVEIHGLDSGWNLAVWGRNLTDGSYLTTNDDGIQSNHSYWNAPRTFGVTLSCRY